jgi:hypothetical protein
MKRYLLIIPMLLVLGGCVGGPGVKMDPFTPDEVNVLVHAATATYLMERNVSPDVARKASAYVATVRSTVTTGAVDLAALRVQVVDNVPAQWQPLAAATWVILLKRINLQQLIADGEHAKVREYIEAALSGAATALTNRAQK